VASPRIPGTPPRMPTAPSMPRIGDFGHAPSGVTVRDLQGRFTTGGFGFAWSGLDHLEQMPQDAADHINESIEQVMSDLERDALDYAQENAPWQDVTGDARAGLKSLVVDDPASGRYRLYLGHGVSYGVYLELSNGGQFAIIIPTLQHFAGQISERLRSV
jgi:hypothetical protein